MKGKKKFIVLGVVVVIGALGGIAIQNQPEAENNVVGDSSGNKVEVEEVRLGNIQTKISSSGKLEAIDSETIYMDTTNKVVSLYKKAGDVVKAGEVILILDEEAKLKTEKEIETLQLQLAAAKQNLDLLISKGSEKEILEAQTVLSQSKQTKLEVENNIKQQELSIKNLQISLDEKNKEFKLQEELLAEGLIAQKDRDDLANDIAELEDNIEKDQMGLETLRASLDSINKQIEAAEYNVALLLNEVEDASKRSSISEAQSQIKSIETQIYNSQTDLNKEKGQVVAPIDGVLTVAPNEEGETIAAGEVLLTIVDPSKLKVDCDISPYYGPDMKIGLKAEIKYTGSTVVEVPGEVSKVSAIAETRTSTNGDTTVLPVEVQVSEESNLLKPGFSVDVKIVTEEHKDVSLISMLSIIEEDDLSYVYVVDESGTLEKREVQEGLSNNLDVEVAGLNEGEVIVTNPGDYLSDGSKVFYEKLGDE